MSRAGCSKEMTGRILAGLILVGAVSGFTGCVTGSGGNGKGLVGGPATGTASDAYYEFEHDGRIFVIGAADVAKTFKDNPELPHSQTMVGEGPKGETVVVQVDKDDPSLQKRLWTKFKEDNLYYAEETHDGRLVVIGSPITHLKYLNTKQLRYTQTMMGEGPAGETVVIEVDKDNPHLQARLWKTFQAKHLFYEEHSHDGRTIVIGSAATAKKFKANPQLPLSKTLVGAGKQGETLVFEVDKSNPALAGRLIRQYEAKHSMSL